MRLIPETATRSERWFCYVILTLPILVAINFAVERDFKDIVVLGLVVSNYLLYRDNNALRHGLGGSAHSESAT